MPRTYDRTDEKSHGTPGVGHETSTSPSWNGVLLPASERPYPGNSSVNFVGPGLTVANGVITALSAGKIKIRTGPASSHVIVDVIGSLL